MSQFSALRPGPGDLLVTPGFQEFLIGQMSPDGREWKALDATPTLALALRKSYMYALIRHTRVLVSRTGDDFQLLDPRRLWLGIERVWWPHDAVSIATHVPREPGVYVVRALTPIVVGDTENLRERLLHHLEEESRRDAALQFCFEVVPSVEDRAGRAADLIDWWSPPCNRPA